MSSRHASNSEEPDSSLHPRAVFTIVDTTVAPARVSVGAATQLSLATQPWHRRDRPPAVAYQLRAGATLVVDEAGMLSTPALHDVVELAEANRWRLVLVGDPRQLQAVGRGGLFDELCTNCRVDVLEHLRRFRERWEAAASLQLRAGDPRAIDWYVFHDRVHPGSLDTHVHDISLEWLAQTHAGRTVGVVASSNEHVDQLNQAIQNARLTVGDISLANGVPIAGGETAYVGDVVMTRRNDRRLTTSNGETVRNREQWIVAATGAGGSLLLERPDRTAQVALPVEYVREHVRLGYAATEHGWQADTVDISVSLASASTTRRGLYVAMTRGRDENHLHVVTETGDLADAVDTLERILAVDRADTPAVTTRRQLAEHDPPRPRLVPRCEIPYWFDDLVAQARADLNDAQRRAVDLHDRHREVASRLAATTTQLDRVTRETAPERAEVRAAAESVSNAEVRHRIVERRLGEAPLRHRRTLRRELNACGAELDVARCRLNDVTVRTGDDMQQYGNAWALHNEAVDDEHSLHLATILDGWQLDPPTAAARVDALDTWRTWAAGRQVTAEHLDDAAAALAEWNHADVRRLVVSLAELGIETWTARAIEPTGIDLDL